MKSKILMEVEVNANPHDHEVQDVALEILIHHVLDMKFKYHGVEVPLDAQLLSSKWLADN